MAYPNGNGDVTPPVMEKINTNIVTLTRFLTEEQIKHKEATGDFTLLCHALQFSFKSIAYYIRRATLVNLTGLAGSSNTTGDDQKKLDVISNDLFIEAMRSSGKVAMLVSEEEENVIYFKDAKNARYAVACDPIDGSSNLDAGVSVGTIFAIHKLADDSTGTHADILKPGTELVAAGFTMYGASAQLVITMKGGSVNGFTLDNGLGEFILTHPDMRLPKKRAIYSVNEGNSLYWEDNVKAYFESLKQAPEGGKPYSARYIGSMVADAYRTLLYGGIFAYPADKKSPKGKLRILYECAPMAMVFENAGGQAVDSNMNRMLEVVPEHIHDKAGIFMGSYDEVEKVKAFHKKLSALGNQLSGGAAGGKAKILEKNADDIVVTAALRTAICRGGKGSFKDTAAADLMAGALAGIIERSGINPALVEDICVGTVLAPGGGATEMRAASLVAGFPDTAAVRTLNRQCSSGLQACVDVANQIRAGMIEIGIGAGVESMSTQYGPRAVTEFSDLLESHPEAANCKVPMGVLSEDMAKARGVTRASQDAFAAASFQKAGKAQAEGLFKEEIHPIKVKFEDPKSGETKEIVVDKDDGIRPGVTAESLGKIRPAFAKDGSIHAGNASQVSDGAAAVLLMKRSTAEKLGQKILGKFVAASIVGVAPLLMGIGPWKAIPKVFELTGLTKEDVDIFEINEAFASQCLWCANELGIPQEKINPKGGAIAFGHPLGCTGARQVSTLLYELKRRNQKIGVTSMCVGTGMGMAAVWVAE
ncbi:hypothetical protein QBC34DRAFT_445984 [Podospora aff. communis PSN243]|uniref:Fructose-1,6-bisphosphatase n=1 Tax=Podospora aff. communis PSN243 TaxID=3040156 RepID=A0AAV9GZX2_9PEZI|nr:hypothetical protein QBC34DRAFT_445984 [Podospora aff. communis PSN243]